jgi:hypothetical protein
MYSNKVGAYSFEYDSESSKIFVFEESKGVDPIHLIDVVGNLTEKAFHYEIMDFISKRG